MPPCFFMKCNISETHVFVLFGEQKRVSAPFKLSSFWKILMGAVEHRELPTLYSESQCRLPAQQKAQ